MKLRNKKTGEVVEYDNVGFRKSLSDGWEDFVPDANSLAELNEKWEDYEPKEPLLKDYPNEMEAIRAYGCSPLRFHRHARKGYSTFNFCTHFICFSRLFENLKDGETYTIKELCGEETPEPLEPTFIDLDERIKEKEEE